MDKVGSKMNYLKIEVESNGRKGTIETDSPARAKRIQEEIER